MKLYIYKLHPKEQTETSLCYVGATAHPTRRFYMHKYLFSYRVRKSVGGYCSAYKIFEKYGMDNVTYTVVAELEYENKDDVRKVEYEWIVKSPNCVNIMQGKTVFDRLAYHREYKRNYGMMVCQCGAEITRNGKSMHMKTKRHQNYIEGDCIKDELQNQPILIQSGIALEGRN